jgi:hypothetical protein
MMTATAAHPAVGEPTVEERLRVTTTATASAGGPTDMRRLRCCDDTDRT